MDRHPTEQKILDEAIRVIETSGEASLRVQKLEEAVNVSAPSIYHFFGSREGLVAEAQAERLTRSFEEFDRGVAPLLASATDADEFEAAVRELHRGMVDPSRIENRERRLFALGSAEGRPLLATRMGDLARERLKELVHVLRPYQEKGWIDPALDIDAFALWLGGQVVGRVYVELGAEPAPHPEYDAISERALVAMLFGHRR